MIVFLSSQAFAAGAQGSCNGHLMNFEELHTFVPAAFPRREADNQVHCNADVPW